MPKATCPACKTEVKYAKGAEVGSTVTCPDCDEVFTPPKLMKKEKSTKYDPEKDEDTFKVGRTDTKAEDRDKSAAFESAARAVRRREREEAAYRKQRPPLFGGPEIVLLVFAAAFTLALPVGFGVAKRFPNTGETALIMFAYLGMVFAGGIKMIRARRRHGG